MCGRYTLSATPEAVAGHFNLSGVEPLQPRYNIAPSQLVAVIGLKPDGARRGLVRLKWGIVPHWENDPDKGFKPINARSETILTKPFFRDAFKSRRCLIPADGFYEWMADGKKKRPHHIRLKGSGLMGFAGLWDRWTDGTRTLLSCCLITCAPNELVKPIHDRMPVILDPMDYADWLNPEMPVDDLLGLLTPYPADQMEMVAVGSAVGSPKNDGPECLQAA
ncbi:MAG: SOS response-associated peptidase [Gemmataceae bacterium]